MPKFSQHTSHSFLLTVGLPLLVCFVAAGCPQRDVSSECYRFYRHLNPEQRAKEFQNYDTDKQFRIYRCGFEFVPEQTGQASQIADKGEAVIPDLVKRLESTNDPIMEYAIILVFERMSASGDLNSPDEITELIARTTAEMPSGWWKDDSENALARVRENLTNSNKHPQ